tara:strand:- start:2655 stop:3374 length:720 start_codon:yes stop_codon:yes gene_type:complete
MRRIGINIDHIATLRNARDEGHPNIIESAKKIMNYGADSITVHLREDRRHIKDKDLLLLVKSKIPINLEMASNKKMLRIALKRKPKFVCLVPEKRKEITTEGGLNINKNKKIIKEIIKKLIQNNIRTSLFINPNINDIKLSKSLGVDCVELHTGKISNLIKKNKNFRQELLKIKNCTNYAKTLNLEVHAGHGIDYKTAKYLSNIKGIIEFNIGHFIIGESINDGLFKVIKKFKKIINKK